MEKRYMISDASHLVEVESHVLRYWEDELNIEIPRNEMGHRYYTEYHINLFKSIKCLKDRGFLLKAIKLALPEIIAGKDPMAIDVLSSNITSQNIHVIATPTSTVATNTMATNTIATNTIATNTLATNGLPANTDSHTLTTSSSDKLAKFEEILGNIVSKALNENNETLGATVSSSVSNSVLKEMDYLFRLREEKEEERFKKLDETIRLTQNKSQHKKRFKVSNLLHKTT